MIKKQLPSSAKPLALAVKGLILGATLLGSTLSFAKPVTWEDIAKDHLTTTNVLQYGMGTNAQRYSPLSKINEDNVFKLTPAWTYSFGDEKPSGDS